MSVIDDLKAAFAGESQANRKYLAFAKKADQEKLPGVARLFRAAAAAETVHALAELNLTGEVKTTLENLKAAKEGEDYESNTMYPPFVEDAKKEGNPKAERVFKMALEVEKVHSGLYQIAAEAVAQGKDLDINKVYVCPVCGYTSFEKPEKCPICGSPKFDEIE